MTPIIQKLLLSDQDAARGLIEAGLRERFDPYIAAFNPDLLNLAAHHAVFLVARLNAELVATGGYVLEGADAVRIRRMSVAMAYRGPGFASAVLGALLAEARVAGKRRAVLLTGETWASAIGLYESHGFVRQARRVDSVSGFVGLEFERFL